jgi:hypothetical protein
MALLACIATALRSAASEIWITYEWRVGLEGRVREARKGSLHGPGTSARRSGDLLSIEVIEKVEQLWLSRGEGEILWQTLAVTWLFDSPDRLTQLRGPGIGDLGFLRW